MTERVAVSARVPVELRDRLTAAAKAAGVPRSELVVRAIEELLEHGPGSQSKALEETLEALDEILLQRNEGEHGWAPADAAMVEAARGIARQLDDDGSNAAMWRQYRETLAMLRGPIADDERAGVFERFLAEVSAEVGDPPAT